MEPEDSLAPRRSLPYLLPPLGMYRRKPKSVKSHQNSEKKSWSSSIDPFEVKRGDPTGWTMVDRVKKAEEEVRLKRVLIVCSVLVRFASVIFVRSQFVPDEDWQSTEVAHKYIFGYGHLTWEWVVGLRSYLYPLFISLAYQILRTLSLDTPYTLILIPKLGQAFLTSIGESFFFLYCIRRYGVSSTKWIAYISLSCWFYFFCSSRTLTNTAEMSLNMIALYYLDNINTYAFTLIVALNFCIRPTAVVIWVPLAFKILRYMFSTPNVFRGCIVIGAAGMLLNAITDWVFYGRWVFPPWNFFLFNFAQGGSAQFGSHPLPWYFYNGLPSILGLNSILLLLIVVAYKRRHREDIQILLFYLLVFSLIAHKEIRFLLPILPTCFALIGDSWSILLRSVHSNWKIKRLMHLILLISLVSNVLAAIFFSAYHQVGIKPATRFINGEIIRSNLQAPKIWFMMPCYSVPAYTYIHQPNAALTFFTCGPALDLVQKQPHFLQEDFSQLDIGKFVREQVSQANSPHFILTYDHSTNVTLSALELYAQKYTYSVCASFFHTPNPFDNIGRSVQVICGQNY